MLKLSMLAELPSATLSVVEPVVKVGVWSLASATDTVYEIVEPVLVPSLIVRVTA